MKLLLQLAVIAAFATPVLAHAADVSQPAHKVADDAAATPKKHKKHGKKKAAAAAPATTEAAPAAPAEGGK